MSEKFGLVVLQVPVRCKGLQGEHAAHGLCSGKWTEVCLRR